MLGSLDHAGHFAPEGRFTQFVTAKTELPEHAARTTGLFAAIAQTGRVSVTRQRLQFQACGSTILFGCRHIGDDGFQRGALGGELGHQLLALCFTVFQCQLSHGNLNS